MRAKIQCLNHASDTCGRARAEDRSEEISCEWKPAGGTGPQLGIVAGRHRYVRGNDGQFYDASAVEGRVGGLGFDPARRPGLSFRDDQPQDAMRPRLRYSLDIHGLMALE